MIIAITGGRDREPGAEEMRQFWDFWKATAEAEGHDGSGHVLVDGDGYGTEGKMGTDRWVRAHVEGEGFMVDPCPIDHAIDGPWPGAGPRRNGRMLVTKKVQALVKFPGNRGTNDCTRQARGLGLFVREITAGDPPRKGRGDEL